MRTSLTEALRAWRRAQAPEAHPSFDALWALAADGVADAAAPALDHLTRCARCAADLREMAEAIDEAAGWDVALAKAAGARLSAPIIVRTACGRYAVAIHPRGDADEAVVTVEVASEFRQALEGTIVTVSDRSGRELLSAPLVLGRASGRLRGIAALDCTRLVVKTHRTETPA